MGISFAFIKALNKIQLAEKVSKEDIENLVLLIENAFENAGVELYSPEVGLNYRDNNHLFSSLPREVETPDKNKDFLVKEIVLPGLPFN